MGRNSGGVRESHAKPSKPRDYYSESKRLRSEVLSIADGLKGNPMRFTIDNKITMDVEVTKSDLKTIVGKNTNYCGRFKNIIP